jgi:hypothetical protein
MKVEHILADEDELADAFPNERVNHFALQKHDIIIDGIVPFPDHFDDDEVMLVIGKEYLEVERGRTEVVPLRMDVKIVDGVGEFELAVFAAVERRQLILLGNVYVPPAKIWFDVVHTSYSLSFVPFSWLT